MHSDTERLYSEEPPAVAIGTVIHGRYRIDLMLGSGAMGQVFAAHHLGLDKRVALKFLKPEFTREREYVERFSREARAATRIKSEHVVDVSDVGTLDNGTPFMVMERLDGMDLDAWRVQQKMPPIAHVVDLLLQACEGIAEAHTLNIVHRDLKPANLFVTRHGGRTDFVKVLDFGVSKIQTTEDQRLTRTGQALGTPYYMAPEQLQGSDVDARADVWAIGVILYELLTGSLPFDGPTVGALAFAIVSGRPKSVRDHRPDVSSELEALVLRCLAPHRDARVQSVAELAIALSPFAEPRSRASIDSICRVMGYSPPQTPTQEAVQPHATDKRMSPAVKTLLFMVAMTVIGAAAGFAAMHYLDQDESDSTSKQRIEKFRKPVDSAVIPVEKTTKAKSVAHSCVNDRDCDAVSGGKCVDARCANQWAAWPISNTGKDVAAGAGNLAAFVDNGDGTVTDNLTQLVWEKIPSTGAYSWRGAADHCAASALADHSDWRMPSMIELVSIIDHGQSQPSLDTNFFPKTTRMRFWSSTRVAESPGIARYVNFDDGSTFADPVTEPRGVRCVR